MDVDDLIVMVLILQSSKSEVNSHYSFILFVFLLYFFLEKSDKRSEDFWNDSPATSAARPES